MSSTSEVTQLLIDWSEGDKAALDKLIPYVYDELRRLARKCQPNRPQHRASPVRGAESSCTREAWRSHSRRYCRSRPSSSSCSCLQHPAKL
ncbi:MAG TPA: ECF-type sigma factor [Blastocatellia bacterium]|nr:ECF-type sigma factor [Blastocatellia bacterium]